MSDFKALAAKMKEAAEKVRSQIKALDAEIEVLFEERQAINAAPVSKDDFMEYLRDDIRRLAARMPEMITSKWARDGQFNNFEKLEKIDIRGGAQGIPYVNGETHIERVELGSSAFYWYFGDLIADRFEQVAEGMAWPADAMPVTQRRQRIREIEAKISNLTAQRNMLLMDLRGVVI